MKKKLLIGLLISGLFITNAHAWSIIPKPKTVVLAGAVVGSYLAHKSTVETINYLKENPLETPNYFEKYPEKYEAVKKSILKLLKKENNPYLYNRYHKIAELMGLDNIPEYNSKVDNLPLVNQNPIQEQSSNDLIYENPIQQLDNSNIIYDNYGNFVDISTEFPIERPKSWEDYLLLKKDSTILGNNLYNEEKSKDSNYVKPDNVAAHHIIPATDKESQSARDILNKYGIDINDAVNGVYLPTSKNNNGVQGIEHNGRHPKSYAETVSNLIEDADANGGQKEVIKTLNDIKNKLQNAPRNSNWRNVL